MNAFGIVVALSCAAQPAPSDVNEPLDVRYARAELALAEANLARVNEMNRRTARSVPASVVADFQQQVEVRKAQLQQAASGGAANDFQAWLRRAEAIWKSADTLWKNADAVNKRSPRSIEPLDVTRYRLRAEVARLQLERGKALATASQQAQLQWKTELLSDEVQFLKEEATRAVPIVRIYPWWR